MLDDQVGFEVRWAIAGTSIVTQVDLVIFFIVVGALIGGVVVVDRRLQDEHSDPGDWWIW